MDHLNTENHSMSCPSLDGGHNEHDHYNDNADKTSVEGLVVFMIDDVNVKH